MTDEAKDAFLSLPASLKPIYLAALIHNLTITGREYRSPDVDQEFVYQKLIRINEVIHQISSKLRAIVANDERQYPDDLFVDIIFEKAGERFVVELKTEMVRTLQTTANSNDA